MTTPQSVEQNEPKFNKLRGKDILKQCTHIRADGSRCLSIASNSSNGNQLCPIHSGLKPWTTAKIDITRSLTDVKKYLARLIRDNQRGKVAPQVTNASVNGVNALIKVHEIEEIQKYLASTVHTNALDQVKDSIPADYTLND